LEDAVFLTYLYRELRRRHRQAILTALGLALGIALVVTVSAVAGGVRTAQDQVLHSLYGVGTDITVTKSAARATGGPMQFGMNPQGSEQQGQRFSRDRVMTTPGLSLIAASKVTTITRAPAVGSAVGGLKLTSLHVSGRLPTVSGNGGSSGGPPALGGGAAPAAQASMAPIKITAVTIEGVDVADQSIGPLSSTTVTSGRTFTSSETNAKVAVLDAGYARQNSLTVGKTLTLGGTKYTIVGISKSASADANVYVPLRRAQTLADAEDNVNQIYVKASSATQIASVKREIKLTMPGATVTTAQDLADQVSGSLSSASKLANQLGKWLAVAALIAAIAVASLLVLSGVGRRVREFGTLKAIGWRSHRVVSQVLGEALVMGVAGGIAGVALGYAGTRLIGRLSPSLQATVATAGFPTGGSSPGAFSGGPGGPGDLVRGLSHTVTVSLHAVVSPTLLATAIALAIGGGLIAGALGGWRAARLSPADALRRVD
jgi:ABC-type antimicrobial peptide transport system permease subunit